MKRKNAAFFLLCAILFLNIIFTQYMVHQYFYENYKNTIIFAGLNLVLFPAAIIVYKLDRKRRSVKHNEQ